MNTKLHAVVAAAALALTLSAGGIAAADHAHSLSEDASDELPDEYDLTVIDPDDRLTGGEAERALALAWGHDDVQDAFTDSDTYDVTVQATDDDVTVVIDGEDGEAAGVDLDLEAETITDVFSGDQIRSADAVDSRTLTDLEGENGTVSVEEGDNGTMTLSEDDIDMEVTSVHPLASAAIDVVDEDDVLSDDQRELLTNLVSSDSDMDEHVTDLLDHENETSVEEWTATVSEVDDSIFVDDENAVAVELSYDGTADAVKAFVALDNEEVDRVVPVRTLDVTASVGIDIGSDSVEIVDEEDDG